MVVVASLLLLLGRLPRSSIITYRAVRFRPATSDYDTAWSYNDTSTPSFVGGCDLIATAQGPALVVSAVAADGLPRETRIWVFKGSTMKTVAVPDGAGCRVGFGADGSVLLYCLPATSAVTRVDLDTGEAGIDIGLGAPSGSYVVVAAE